ncbi:MAG: glycosyltransferase family 39 protein [Bdellovibrionota bacterium]
MFSLRKFSSAPTALWIFLLTLVAVSYQFFAVGLGGDSPLYAGVARHMFESGDFWHMYSGLPEFQPFAEHPHLGFWITAVFFKVFGVHDWSYRAVGQIFYFGSLGLTWRIVARNLGRERANVAVLLLWTWPLFSKYFANAYLDAGFIFFSLLAIELCLSGVALAPFLGGIALGVALLYKGTVGMALGPIFLVGLFGRFRMRDFACLVGGALFPPLIYVALLSRAGYPEFITQYLVSVSRRGSAISLRYFFEVRPYISIFEATFGLVVIVPLLALWKRSRLRDLSPFAYAWVGIFAVAYVATGRRGAQYWATLMPCLAWIFAACLPEKADLAWSEKLRGFSFLLALVLIPLSQLWPRPLRWKPDAFMESLRETQLRENNDMVWIDTGEKIVEDFSNTGRLLWYSRIPEARYIQPGDDLPVAEAKAAFVLMRSESNERDLERRNMDLTKFGWCLEFLSDDSRVSHWSACPQTP